MALKVAIQQSKESPEEVADHEFFNALYQKHPYAHPVSGTKNTLEANNKKDNCTFLVEWRWLPCPAPLSAAAAC